jgi:hypothetical protein
LGAHAPPWFKSPRSVLTTNQKEKHYPTTWCAIKSFNAKHKLNEKQYPATWCPNKSSSGKHKLRNPMLTKLNLITTQHKTKYHFWWFKKMYSLAMHRNPSPNTMLIASVTCINTQQLWQKIRAKYKILNQQKWFVIHTKRVLIHINKIIGTCAH